MNKRGWWIPLLILLINAGMVLVRWSSLQTQLPAHFDLQGNASGTMPRAMLLLYLLVGVAIVAGASLVARWKPRLETGLVILTSGALLVLLASTCVTLTAGTMPIFMLAEPVILLAAVVGFVISVVMSRKKSE